jgi:hypothetical protein
MSTDFIFPKPRDWDTFEDIVCDVFARKLSNRNLQRYGRRGQAQSGVDVAGLTQDGVLGIQCKHHPTGSITTSEIDEEVAKSEGFRPELDEFTIATSADRDTAVHSYVLELSKRRVDENKYPVVIKFWEDIYGWLCEFPDLIHRHFTKYFPTDELEEIRIPASVSRPKATLRWPVTPGSLKENVIRNIGGLKRVEPYKLTVGFTSFPDIHYDGVVDLEISLSELFADESSDEAGFVEAAGILNDVKAVVRDPYFSDELWIHLEARLAAAFLLGWVFRGVSHFDLRLVFSDQVWATSGLPLVPSGVSDGLPVLIPQSGGEVAVVLNVSRNIDVSVADFIGGWDSQPRAILVYELEGNRIASAAHALSLAIELSRRMKTVIDKWRPPRIHLFGAMPAALATLIGYHLNAICPISIYFLDDSRTRYELGGTLVNDL